jgi:hypothetical protein
MGTENPRVGSSILSLGTNYKKGTKIKRCTLFVCVKGPVTFRTSILQVGTNSLKGFLKSGKIILKNLPNYLQVDTKIFMHDSIAQTNNLSPLDL